jgi:hypothetical protein
MISLFGKPPYMMRHLQRLSTTIRGEQLAAYMHDARLNPESGYENDVCIYIKPNVKIDWDFKFEGRKSYLDIVDGFELIHLLRKHPEIPGIVFSDLDEINVRNYVENEIVNIPHHHCNFERRRRNRTGFKKIGVIGSMDAFQHIPDEIRTGIKNRGLELIEYSMFYPRMAVVDFYLKMDAMLVWRPFIAPLTNPFKIVNASSFGIPTIAKDEPAFKEMDGCYMPVNTVNEFFDALDKLRSDQDLYSQISKTCIEKSERYHISKIAELYRQLDK